jgi:hypothetical protein
VIPCKALKAVAAQGGFAKSTKQRIKGSPPRCNKQEFHHKKHNGISNQSSKQTKTNQNKQGQTDNCYKQCTYMLGFFGHKSHFSISHKRAKNI